MPDRMRFIHMFARLRTDNQHLPNVLVRKGKYKYELQNYSFELRYN